jgi:hypothetical protein
MKLKARFTAAELRALDQYMVSYFSQNPMEDLRKYPAEYLICSSLHELYLKIHAKVDDIRTFPTRKTDHEYPITLTRSQCLAIVCTVSESGPDPSGIETYEGAFFNRLVGRIYQEFLI